MDASTATSAALFGLEAPICPYTGLRTFTEEEAIYFRGREAHVGRCLALLAEQRFVMVTGASGDGKSSLVFAGLLPEVRAGFLRARYSSWVVASFRPERSPLQNMAQALAGALRLPSWQAVASELGQGFSALVALYQTSALCPPAPPEGLTPAEQRRHQRGGANLLLVVDQFEEFFTNPENYDGDTPTNAAQTVVNLLLETTRLAQAQNLPIYIVCTMRSDFVGQCAEFRGLIEQVGASQYFVPRLLRHEFAQVIQEPAGLSGNRISERLVQRLLYDIGPGQDQLPVLQHALRRIWLAADQGREEMDLLHYAMVGGLADELPPADQARFAQWRATLTEQQQQFLLANASLRNVLDAHANQLYAEATALYNRDFAPPLPPGTAERVIEQTFRVLTRTDGKRVVRNRLTGAQITAILADEALPWPVVCHILRPFREEGTTFLSPFLGEADDDRAVLPADTVLDISHESLIRNWNHLAEWTLQEAQDVRIAQNFMQQASRWHDNAESTGFLLPIGFYSFFAQWHAGKKGAASWLAYYLEPGPDTPQHQQQAATQNDVLTRFLKASRRRLWFSLVVARYGVKRLVWGLVLALLALGVAWQAVRHRMAQSDYVAYAIVQECTAKEGTLNSPYVAVADKARFIINADRLKEVLYRPWLGGRPAADYAFPKVLDRLHNDTLALHIELTMYACTDNLGYDSVERENPYSKRILFDLEKRLDRATHRDDSLAALAPRAQARQPKLNIRLGDAPKANPKGKTVNFDSQATSAAQLSDAQRREAVLTARTIMALAYYLRYDEQDAADSAVHRHFAGTQRRLLRHLRTYVQREVRTTTGPPPNPTAFAFCLHVLLGQGTDRPADLAFLGLLSPFGPDSTRFKRFFPPTPLLNYRTGTTTQSGGYPVAAIIFAALGQRQPMLQCLAIMRQQVADVTDVNSGIALLPYLIKYQALTAANLRETLEACAGVGGFSFNELYAATVYSLLSVQATQAVFDVSHAADYDTRHAQNAPQLAGFAAGYLNADRVSFTLPTAPRDAAWAALQGATLDIATNQPIFIESEEHDLVNEVPEQYYVQRNVYFLNAFLAKMHGVYQAEVKQQPALAAQEFGAFSRSLEALQQHLLHNPANKAASVHRNHHQINTLQWNLGGPQQLPPVIGTTQASTGPQSPLTFLRLPTRPKTLAFETYYTCSFNSFFGYELQRAATAARPDTVVIALLDSVAFVEAAFPDRFSNIRSKSLFTEAVARPAWYRPNLAWIRAIASTRLPGDSARHQRNALLLRLEETLQNHDQLQDSAATRRLMQQLPQLPPETRFRWPLEVAFSNLATALAHEGRVTQAYGLAGALAEPMRTITQIRASEQLMLTDNRSAQATYSLDNLLFKYYFLNTPKLSWLAFEDDEVRKSQPVAASIIPLFYWFHGDFNFFYRLFLRNAPSNLSESIDTNELSPATGLYAALKGYSLAGEAGAALQQIPPYEAARARQIDYNYLLLGIAHRKTSRPGDGWREYDEARLTLPADYDGPIN
jgi:hypothetical protein